MKTTGFKRQARLSPRDYTDYLLFTVINSELIQGYLGNISENGMCAIMPKEHHHYAEGDLFFGYIQFNPIQEKIDVSGIVRWTKDYDFNGELCETFGIEFTEKLYLPDHLFVLSMSLED